MHKVITLPEGSRGVGILMAFCAYNAVHLKEQPYLNPDGDLVGITYIPRRPLLLPYPLTTRYEAGIIASSHCQSARLDARLSHFYF